MLSITRLVVHALDNTRLVSFLPTLPTHSMARNYQLRSSLTSCFVCAVFQSPKGQQLRLILRNEFKKNMAETDPVKIAALKGK